MASTLRMAEGLLLKNVKGNEGMFVLTVHKITAQKAEDYTFCTTKPVGPYARQFLTTITSGGQTVFLKKFMVRFNFFAEVRVQEDELTELTRQLGAIRAQDSLPQSDNVDTTAAIALKWIQSTRITRKNVFLVIEVVGSRLGKLFLLVESASLAVMPASPLGFLSSGTRVHVAFLPPLDAAAVLAKMVHDVFDDSSTSWPKLEEISLRYLYCFLAMHFQVPNPWPAPSLKRQDDRRSLVQFSLKAFMITFLQTIFRNGEPVSLPSKDVDILRVCAGIWSEKNCFQVLFDASQRISGLPVLKLLPVVKSIEDAPLQKEWIRDVESRLERLHGSTNPDDILHFNYLLASFVRQGFQPPYCVCCYKKCNPENLIQSHIITQHYLALMNVAACIDKKSGRTVLTTNFESMKKKLQCSNCDQKLQGPWESDFKVHHSAAYKTLGTLAQQGHLADGHEILKLNSKITYGFIAVNMFRYIFVNLGDQLSDTFKYAIVQALRNWILEPQRPGGSETAASKVYMYVAPVDIVVLAAAFPKLQSFFSETEMDQKTPSGDLFEFEILPGKLGGGVSESVYAVHFPPFIVLISLNELDSLTMGGFYQIDRTVDTTITMNINQQAPPTLVDVVCDMIIQYQSFYYSTEHAMKSWSPSLQNQANAASEKRPRMLSKELSYFYKKCIELQESSGLSKPALRYVMALNDPVRNISESFTMLASGEAPPSKDVLRSCLGLSATSEQNPVLRILNEILEKLFLDDSV